MVIMVKKERWYSLGTLIFLIMFLPPVAIIYIIVKLGNKKSINS